VSQTKVPVTKKIIPIGHGWKANLTRDLTAQWTLLSPFCYSLALLAASNGFRI